MKIQKITQRDGSLVLISGYLFGRSRNFDEGRFCNLLKQITHRDNIQFALVQGDATPVDAVVAQIYEQDAQGLILHTKVDGEWMMGVNLMLDTHYKAESIQQLSSVDEFRWPDETNIYECEVLVKIDEFLQKWNQLEGLEDQIKAVVKDKDDEVVRLLWKAAGITHEYSTTFKEAVHNYITYKHYEHPELVPYMMRSANWRSDGGWYPKTRIC